MSKRSKRRKTVELRERNNAKQTALMGEISTDGREGKDSVRVRPVLTVMLAASVLLVAAVSIIDYNGTYGEYRTQHEEAPYATACVDALSENVFPWTGLTAYAAVNQGYVNSGPGAMGEENAAMTKAADTPTYEASATEEAIVNAAKKTEGTEDSHTEAASAGKSVKAWAGKNEGTAAKSSALDGTSAGPGITTADDASGVNKDLKAGETKTFTKVDMSYFADAAFVGDSFTQGLMLYADIPGADCLCYQSKTTKNIMDSEIHLKNGSTSTVRNELSKKQYGKVYIMLGINELSSDAAGFASRYQKVISEIRALQPDAVIFIQSIFHTTPNKSANSNFKNVTIDQNNQAIKALADNKTVFYVDVNPPFDDGTGALRADYSGDGVHLKAARYKDWRDYLLNYGIK